MGVLDTTKDTAKKVAEMAQDGLSEAKDRWQEMVLKRRVNGISEEIGHVVLRQRAGEEGFDPAVERLVADARAIEAEITALSQS